jgi:uncharacterized integral membrane protein
MRWILLLPLFILLILFSISNQDLVPVRLWPFDLEWMLPLSVAMLAFSALFFLLGAGIAWASGLRHRGRARRLEATVRGLEDELADFRAARAKPIGPVPPQPGAYLAKLQRSA